MLTIEAELKSPKRFGMAAGYAEVASQGLDRLQVSEGLLRHLLQVEAEDRHIRSIRYLRVHNH
jgi:hypothetical protein